MTLSPPQKALRQLERPNQAGALQRFFKTGPGQYGEGDQFIGITVPEIRRVALAHKDSLLPQLAQLLKSPIHEDRLLALLILVGQFQRAQTKGERAEKANFYLKMKARINNWDLVDASAHKIMGEYCWQLGRSQVLAKLVRSPQHWDRRIGIVATYAYIRQGETELTYSLAERLLEDEQDLMHKATGWMLREAGKRDGRQLRKFIAKHGRRMPRTMLRYSIEKFSAQERAQILLRTRG